MYNQEVFSSHIHVFYVGESEAQKVMHTTIQYSMDLLSVYMECKNAEDKGIQQQRNEKQGMIELKGRNKGICINHKIQISQNINSKIFQLSLHLSYNSI